MVDGIAISYAGLFGQVFMAAHFYYLPVLGYQPQILQLTFQYAPELPVVEVNHLCFSTIIQDRWIDFERISRNARSIRIYRRTNGKIRFLTAGRSANSI